MDTFGIIGNPINHSQSPLIHTLFAIECGISPFNYNLILAPLNEFEQKLQKFFDIGGLGINITLPFKVRAKSLCGKLTERSLLTGVVNCIKKQSNGVLLGDNTDGIGLLDDLQRLNILDQDLIILLVGAGGVSRGVILSLLNYGCKIVLTNRTFSRAQELVNYYQYSGNISAIPLEELNKYHNYDLLINATSTSMYNTIPQLPPSLISSRIYCYDMYYQADDTSFIKWCRYHGARGYSDGLGMLVSQAAYTFLLWHGVLPSVIPTLKKLRLKLSKK